MYRARAPQLGGDVAVKVLRPGSDPDRFLREARTLAGFTHPNIVPLYVVGEAADGRPFMAMKLVPGRTLYEAVRAGDPRPDARERLLDALADVCEAVAYAHARGVVHRNLVPWKVRIGAAGGAYLTGWGEARVLVEPEPPVPMTLVGPVAFVPAYVAPERVRGTRGDARTDVFGLGGLLCFLLTGRPPHPTDGGFVDAITRCLAGDFSDTFARLDACGADPRLVAVAKRCLAANPDHRYADAGEVAEAIAGCRHAAEESPAPPTPAPTPTEVVRAEPAPGGAEPTPAVAPPRRRWLVVAAVVAAALLVFGTALLRGR